MNYLKKDGCNVSQIGEELQESHYRKHAKQTLEVDKLNVGGLLEIIGLHHWIAKQQKPVSQNFFLKIIK